MATQCKEVNRETKSLMDELAVPSPPILCCRTCGREMRVNVKSYIDHDLETGQKQVEFWADYKCPKFSHRVFFAPVSYKYDTKDATRLSLAPRWRAICTSQF